MNTKNLIEEICTSPTYERVKQAMPKGCGNTSKTAEERAVSRIVGGLSALGFTEKQIHEVVALVFVSEAETIRHAAFAGARKIRPLNEISPERIKILRPMAETLAMIDGNAFFGTKYHDREGVERDWWEQYIPEAEAIYEGNGGDDGWAGKASFAPQKRNQFE